MHSEGSVGHGVSRVFCLVRGLGSYLGSRFAVSGPARRILLLHAHTHLHIRCLSRKAWLALRTADLGAYAQGPGFGNKGGPGTVSPLFLVLYFELLVSRLPHFLSLFHKPYFISL